MTRSSISTGLLAAGAALLGTLTTPAFVRADGWGTTVYNNYGNAVYYTTTNVNATSNNVSCSRGGAYVPANYPAGFVVPQMAPAAYGAVHREPRYAQPVYVEPGCARPVYTGTRYVNPSPRRSAYVAVGRSYGYSKTLHHRKVHRSRKIVHRSRKSVRRPMHVRRHPRLHVRYSDGHRYDHRPHRIMRHHGRPLRTYGHHRPHRSGFRVSFGHRR